jgi:hypothetical protein
MISFAWQTESNVVEDEGSGKDSPDEETYQQDRR